jgi:predicted alpha/beta hydrolase
LLERPKLLCSAGHYYQAPVAATSQAKQLPGFTNHYATVNGVRLHYDVEGGSGPALLCLPGWPQTWYCYHPIAAALARHYRVIIVDIRGMGSSDKPAGGYDKKTMAQDISELPRAAAPSRVRASSPAWASRCCRLLR